MQNTKILLVDDDAEDRAIIMDAIYQWIVQKWIYPGELIIVAIVLALVPYLLIRGPVNRIARRFMRRDVEQPVNE